MKGILRKVRFNGIRTALEVIAAGIILGSIGTALGFWLHYHALKNSPPPISPAPFGLTWSSPLNPEQCSSLDTSLHQGTVTCTTNKVPNPLSFAKTYYLSYNHLRGLTQVSIQFDTVTKELGRDHFLYLSKLLSKRNNSNPQPEEQDAAEVFTHRWCRPYCQSSWYIGSAKVSTLTLIGHPLASLGVPAFDKWILSLAISDPLYLHEDTSQDRAIIASDNEAL
jgi:hypothetical protein